MSNTDDFKPINTQEEFNALIGNRIAKAKEMEAAKYADYDAIKEELEATRTRLAELGNSLNESNEALKAKDATIQDLEGKVSKYVTDTVKTRIAHEFNLDLGLAERLNGTTEEEIRADAEKLRAICGASQVVPIPLGSTEQKADDLGYKSLIRALKGE